MTVVAQADVYVQFTFDPQGTVDGVMLCMRLALVDALFQKEQPFLLLDDPFVNLDDEATRRALSMLREIAKKRQVVYLTCNTARI